MKYFVLLGVCLMLCVTEVQAETAYVTDMLQITFRSGPGTHRKILAQLKSDQRVEVIRRQPDWSKVRLPDGREGWVVTRYLTTKLPNRIALEKLKTRHAALAEQAKQLREQNEAHQSENEQMKQQLATLQAELSNLKEAYERLKSESAEFLTLKTKYEKSAAQLAEQTQKADTLEDELTKLQWNKNIKWFLGGAGVLIVGFIIGFSSKRQRRRSSLL